MNKIINGRKYDTETAEIVFSISDLCGFETTLYKKKKTGELFFYFKNFGSNGVIIPTTEEGVKEWVAKNQDATFYEKLFGPVEE